MFFCLVFDPSLYSKSLFFFLILPCSSSSFVFIYFCIYLYILLKCLFFKAQRKCCTTTKIITSGVARISLVEGMVFCSSLVKEQVQPSCKWWSLAWMTDLGNNIFLSVFTHDIQAQHLASWYGVRYVTTFSDLWWLQREYWTVLVKLTKYNYINIS